jgi:hypothetical protein
MFVGLAVALLIAACCMVQGWRVSHDTTRSTDQLRVAQKVITDAPTEALEAAERDLPMPGALRTEPLNPATWKLIRLRALVRWDDGTWDDINVETLQPPSWLAAHEVRVGGLAPIPLDLEELGLPDVLGKVLAIEPCPPVPPGPGRVILTTVNHLNADVHELTIRDAQGRQETIRTTGGHKFYSATRTAWVSATDLEPGEQLHGLGGPVHIVSRARLPGIHRVYNLTVEGDHVYHVSPLGVLTHNTWSCFGAPGTAEDASSVLARQKQLSQLVNRQGEVIDRWLAASNNRWARLYRDSLESNPNFAKGIRGRILDIRMRSKLRDMFGDFPGVRIDQTIPQSGNRLRPDLYLPDIDGRRVIFDVGSPSKINDILKYEGMADDLIPLVPIDWVP